MSELTKNQKEVIELLQEGYSGVKIALLTKKSKQAVYKTIRKLVKMGLVQRQRGGGFTISMQSTNAPVTTIRLHGQEFNLKIINKGFHYDKLRKKANTLEIDFNVVRLYEDSIEVYSGHTFWGKDADEATGKSFEYWGRFFRRLESDLDVVLVKSRYQNIKLVKSHYAEVENEVAKDCDVRAEQIKVYAEEDGKLAYLVDKSTGVPEFEALHPETSKRDIERVVKHFNEIRQGVSTNAEIMNILKQVVEANAETAAGLASVVKIMTGGSKDRPGYIQ